MCNTCYIGFTQTGVCINPFVGQKYSSSIGKDFYDEHLLIPKDLSVQFETGKL